MKKMKAYLANKYCGEKITDQKFMTFKTRSVISIASICILLSASMPASANFFVSDSKSKCNQCDIKNSPGKNDAWTTPTLTRTQCEAPECKTVTKQCKVKRPSCPTSNCPPSSVSMSALPNASRYEVVQAEPSSCPFNQEPAPFAPAMKVRSTKPCPSSYCPVPVATTPVSRPVAVTGFKVPTYCPPVRAHKVIAIVYEGSLKNNVERIAREHGWCKVVWNVPVDYRWVGTAKVTGTCLNQVMDVILQQFPLEITFYQANHVVAVTPRKFQA